jgi:hypothetical protein
VNAIRTAIAEQYLDRRWVQFWPRQFVTPVSRETEVVAALTELVAAGKLMAEVTLFCEDGHRAWTGNPTEAQQRVGHPCGDAECDFRITDESVELKFIMTESWRSDLDAANEHAQKKTLRP